VEVASLVAAEVELVGPGAALPLSTDPWYPEHDATAATAMAMAASEDTTWECGRRPTRRR
jgi:hypothetical protein